MIVYLVTISILVYFLWIKTSAARTYQKFQRQVGGPKGYPILGSALDFTRNLDRTLLTLSNYVDQYGDRLSFFFAHFPVLLLCNAEDIEKVCMSAEIIDKSDEYDQVNAFIGKGLITSSGAHWQHRRKLLTPCFHFSILESFVDPINTHARTLASVLSKKFLNGGDEFRNISPYIARCALDIICETSMGIQMNSQTQTDCAYVDAIHRYGELFQYRSIRPWLRSEFMWGLTSKGKEEKNVLKVIHGFTDQVIADRKLRMKSTPTEKAIGDDELDGGRKVKKAFLDMLLESQKQDQSGISDEGIREETTTFIFAGHDTVSVAVSFCLYNLGNTPDVQEKIHQELDAIFGTDLDRNVTSTDLRNLKYMELCIKETLRLFPSVPLIGRHAHKPFKLDENTIIPEGVSVYLLLYKLHRNPKYFTKPDAFIPERFDPENVEFTEERKRSAFSYAPFSAGMRNCIGQKLAMMEAKVVLATVLRKFKVKSEMPAENLELLSEIVLRVRNGLKVKLEAR